MTSFESPGEHSSVSSMSETRSDPRRLLGSHRRHHHAAAPPDILDVSNTLLSSMSAISIRGSTGSANNLVGQTFTSNTEDLFWARRMTEKKRREEKEKLWQAHIENIRQYRQPIIEKTRESVQKHRLFNKRAREVLQQTKKVHVDVAPEHVRVDPVLDAAINLRPPQRPPITLQDLQGYFYQNGSVILPVKLEFNTLHSQQGNANIKVDPSKKVVGAHSNALDEDIRSDAKFASAQRKILSTRSR